MKMIAMKRLLLLLTAALCAGHLAAAGRPNIILIISDDHSHTDYGFMGSTIARTPHLDRIAAQSLLYTRGYVMPVCSPSLASLLTGQLPHRHGITGNDLAAPPGPRVKRAGREPLIDRLLQNSLLLPKALTDAGYLTFQSGKLWNMSYKQAGFTHGMTAVPGRHGDAGLAIGRQGLKPLTDFIDDARKQAKPFFVWYAPMMPHDPHTPPKEIFKKYEGKGPTPAAEKYFAMVEWFDQTCGELDRHLADHKLAENTVILYLADNGWDSALGYKGSRAKLTPYETGIRTPMFVRWPGHVSPRRDDATLASIIDFAPTILKLAGVGAPADLPGLDLTDTAALRARKAVFVEAYTHDIADLAAPGKSLLAQVVISGWSKLLIPGPAKPDRPFSTAPAALELFDLKADLAERRNLAAQNIGEVLRLQALQNQNWPLP
jgi:uncharacterized sulfatase